MPVLLRVTKVLLVVSPMIVVGDITNAVDDAAKLAELAEKADRLAETQKMIEVIIAYGIGKRARRALMVDKAMKTLSIGSRWIVTEETFRNAVLKSVEHTKKAGDSKSVTIWSILMLICGGLITLHVVEGES